MYGLPDDFDGSIFVGRVLEMISFSENTVRLDFRKEFTTSIDSSDEDRWAACRAAAAAPQVSIGIESSFEYRPANDETSNELQSPPVTTSAIMQLLGKAVEAFEIEHQGTLVLRFHGGDIFRCIEDDSGYECYHIQHGEREIHV